MKEQIKKKKAATVPGFSLVQTAGGIAEFLFKQNGLRILYLNRPGTGVVTTNITYLVGAKDESRGETGIAHMLEHMLFKPTVFDIAAGTDSAAMEFEREIGCVLNANTWKDRTTYYFSYPREHFERALKIEAERMTGVVLTDESLAPERNNVLSEHDMYNGDPYFALSVAMVGAAYHSHPYGHETIGYREDIVSYTASTLETFYRRYYRPDNAVLMIVGDIDETSALRAVKKYFSVIEKPSLPIPRYTITEPQQEGLRRTSIVRTALTNIVALGVKHAGFPSHSWFATNMVLDILANGPESILHKALIDTGVATSVDASIEPTSKENIAMLTITLAEGQSHDTIEKKVRALIAQLDTPTIAPLLKKTKAKILTDELFARDSSLRIVQELTEYAAAGDWTLYTKTPQLLEAMTPTLIIETAKMIFTEKTMTIGYFIGEKK